MTTFQIYGDTLRELKSAKLCTLQTNLHGSRIPIWIFQRNWQKSIAKCLPIDEHERYALALLTAAYYENILGVDHLFRSTFWIALLSLERIQAAPIQPMLEMVEFLVSQVPEELREPFSAKYRYMLLKRNKQHRKPVMPKSRSGAALSAFKRVHRR
ncbi:MAG: hypothetical protein K2X77_07100 [Candidatus Obscuribacterales bacterium]|jgi:hypothetical protein|nr:hypothetical protein [Candidatus Obscuribacterales bacterium]